VTRLPRGVRAGLAAIAILVFIPLATLAISALPAAWDHWRYCRAIELPVTDATRLAQVTVADEVFLRSGITLNDLRVIDDQGSERPYTVFVLDATKKTENLAATLHERSFVPGEYTQAVVEIKGDAPFHNSLEIETPEQNFIEWVSVDASDDARTWRIVQERAPIFRFNKDGREGTRVVQYSDNNARYLRVRIFNGEKQFPISGVEVQRQVGGGAEERVPVDVQILPDAHAPAGQSIWTADLGGRGIPVSGVHFDVAPMEYVRCVSLAASDDKKEWSTISSGQIYRFHRGEKIQQVLTVPVSYGNAGARYWRVTVENGNDAPLPVANVQLYTTPRHLMFEQQPGRSYTLIYGQERAEAAKYDFGERINEEGRMTALPGKLGPEEVNATWVDPRPWTETHAVFLWGVLLIAVIAIGFTAMQSMRRAAGNPPA
jgi:Protein of unknown function (DUF3999)